MTLIDIFRAGSRPDAHGNVIAVSTEQLAQTAAAYNPSQFEAPIVIGHPKDNSPAYGWVKGLILNGDVLQAQVHQLEPQFAEMVQAGRFKKVSASFYLPDSPNNPQQGVLSLRHVGFLGAMPPAVKGLRDPQFSEPDTEFVAFTEDFIHQPNQEEPLMDTQKDAEKIAELEAKLAAAEQAKADAENAKAEAEKAKAAAESEAQRLNAEKAEAAQKAVEAENANFAEGLITSGKILPKDRKAVLGLLNAQTGTADFSESSFKEHLKAFLNGLPQHYDFTEPVATAEKAAGAKVETVAYAEGTDPSSIEADQKVRAYMKEHNVSYTAAFNAIYR